jgi:hypothetical protein
VNYLCRAFFPGARQKKAIDGAGMRRHTTKEPPLSCAGVQNARQRAPFAMRRSPKRTAINGTFAARLDKRTAKALFLLLVLVTLPCVFLKTHGKVAIAIYLFICFSRLKIPKKSLE